MPHIPTKRLFVYIATGLVVMVVGVVGLVSLRSGASTSAGGVVIDAGSAADESAGTVGGTYGLMAGVGDAAATASSSTSITEAPKIWVQVAGAVRRPGVYQLAADARVFQAVLEAGGFTDDADREATALAAQLSDGCRVYVPRVGEAAAGQIQLPTQSSAGITGGSPAGSSKGGSSTGRVSLNTATLEELDSLPGVGPALAQQIITYRETKGPFTSIDQLDDVPGIGPAKLEQLRPLVEL